MKHAGKRGTCPKCKAPFTVPGLTPEQLEAQKREEEEASVVKQPWLRDLDRIEIDPQNLKLKPGSVAATAEEVDGFFEDAGLTLVSLVVKKRGRPTEAERETAREEIKEHLLAGKAATEIREGEKIVLTGEQLREANVVQPALHAHESMFMGVPVFGEGRIAVRLPVTGTDGKLVFLSFGLTAFRAFAKHLDETFGIKEFGDGLGIPMTTEFVSKRCHYSDVELKTLEDRLYYEADPQAKLKVVGYQCVSCGLIVSEDSRKKEKIGGPQGRSLGRAKCKKCNEKFGSSPLFSVDEPEPANAEA